MTENWPKTAKFCCNSNGKGLKGTKKICKKQQGFCKLFIQIFTLSSHVTCQTWHSKDVIYQMSMFGFGQMITAVQRKALSDEDIRTNQQFAKLFEDTVKVSWFVYFSLCVCLSACMSEQKVSLAPKSVCHNREPQCESNYLSAAYGSVKVRACVEAVQKGWPCQLHDLLSSLVLLSQNP